MNVGKPIRLVKVEPIVVPVPSPREPAPPAPVKREAVVAERR
jgi:hypothetical protein